MSTGFLEGGRLGIALAEALMLKPLRQGTEFLRDLENVEDTEHFALWWLGQSGFLISWRGSRLLIDPYLSDFLTRKYQGTVTPHMRLTERVIDPSRLDRIDVIALTHHHSDHADPETLQALMAANPGVTVVVPRASWVLISERLEINRDRLRPIDELAELRVGPFAINAVPAAHETIEFDEQGSCRYLGYLFQFGPWIVYHSGDSLIYDGLIENLTRQTIALALLPINGRGHGVPGNMTASEAAWVGKQSKARCVIPCHYGMFGFNTARPEDFAAAAERVGVPYNILRNGEKWTSACLRHSE